MSEKSMMGIVHDMLAIIGAITILVLAFYGLSSFGGNKADEPMTYETSETTNSVEVNRFYTDSFHATDKDCSDFASANAAQVFFEEAGSGDPHDLDRDDDGYACEWND